MRGTLYIRIGAAVLALLPSAARASAVDLFGYGARGQAMAGAAASTASGHAAVYYDPAGLAFDREPSFALGFQRAAFDLRIDGEDAGVDAAPALSLGLALPVPLRGPLDRRLALGMALVLPGTSILVADLPRPGDPSFVVLENRAQTVSIQAAVAARPADWLGLGVGLLALAGLDGGIEVKPNDEGRIGSQVRDVVVADYALVAGLRVRPSDRLAFSATWHGESRADFVFPIEADLGDSLGIELPIPTLDIVGTAQFDPAQLTVEGSWRPLPRLLVAAGATWKRWSRFGNPIQYSAAPPDEPALPDPGFEDTWTPRLGLEADLAAGAVALRPRAGLAFEPTPAPVQRGFHNHLDNDRVISGLGLGLGFRDVTFDLAVQWQHLAPRGAVKSADVDAGHPGHPSIRHDGEVLLFGLELGAKL